MCLEEKISNALMLTELIVLDLTICDARFVGKYSWFGDGCVV